jgi:nucleoside phosphorylase
MQGNATVGLVMATYLEAQPFIESMPMEEEGRRPFRIFRGGDIILIISGIGKTNAAVAASYLIMQYNVGVIFNAGAAGAVAAGIRLGDIFHINRVVEYDRPKMFGGGMRFMTPSVMDGHATAVLATQDVPVISGDFRNRVSEHATLVDMEGAAVVHACGLFGIPCYLFKIVSDTVSDQNGRDIVDNIAAVRTDLYLYIMEHVLE